MNRIPSRTQVFHTIEALTLLSDETVILCTRSFKQLDKSAPKPLIQMPDRVHATLLVKLLRISNPLTKRRFYQREGLPTVVALDGTAHH